MAVKVNIDFGKTYEMESISEDLRVTTFYTETVSGDRVQLKVEIDSECHELLPNVFNLAFGPIDVNGKINDRAQYGNPFDFEDILTYPDLLQKGNKIPVHKMYNYFIFKLRDKK